MYSFSGAAILSSTGFIYFGDEKVSVPGTVDTPLGHNASTSPLIEIDMNGRTLRLPPTYLVETCNRGYVTVNNLSSSDKLRVYLPNQDGTLDKVQSPAAALGFGITMRDACYPVVSVTSGIAGAIYPAYTSLSADGYGVVTQASSVPVGSGPDGTLDPNSCYCLVPGSNVNDPDEDVVELTPASTITY